MFDDDDMEIIVEMEIFSGSLEDFIDELEYEDASDIDARIYEDEPVDLSVSMLETPIRFNTPSIIKLIKRSGVIDEDGIPKGITNSAAEYISNIAYTRMREVLRNALIVLDERDAKVLTQDDIINTLRLKGDRIMYSDHI